LTIVVLMLLAVVWVAVLAPPLLRKGVESRRSDSVGDFRRHLGVLQRTGPTVIAPAHTRLARPAFYATPSPAPRTPPAQRASRSQTLRRRRNVFIGLVGSTVLLLAVGAVPGLHVILAVAGASVLLLGAYVAMLIRMRNLAAERDMKLTFLPQAVSTVPGVDPALFLRRSATN
jgi:hypothetical protein